MTVCVREIDSANPARLAELVELHQECFKHLDLEMFKRGFWWIAYDGDQPVAFAGIQRSSSWTNVGYLCRAGVAESHRGRGLQKRLIRVRLARAKRLGWAYAITETHDNPPSANSLISAGFRMYHPRKPWAGRAAHYWMKEL